MIRLAPVALYNTFADVADTARALKEIIDNKEFEAFFPERDAVS